MHGLIVDNWKIEDGKFLWSVAIPANTTATLHVPARSPDAVTEGGKAAGQAEGVKLLRPSTSGRAVYEVGFGTVHFCFGAKVGGRIGRELRIGKEQARNKASERVV